MRVTDDGLWWLVDAFDTGGRVGERAHGAKVDGQAQQAWWQDRQRTGPGVEMDEPPKRPLERNTGNGAEGLGPRNPVGKKPVVHSATSIGL